MEVKDINESIVFNETTLTKQILYATRDVLCFVLNLRPGQTLPAHRHENTSLILNTISGSGEAKVNNETIKLKKGIVLYTKGQDDFSIPEVSENLTLFVTISPNPSNEMYSRKFFLVD